MRLGHLRQEDVRANLGVIGFAATYGMDGLNRNAGGLEKFGRVGVRRRDVGGKAGTLIEPEGLAEVADDATVGSEISEDALTDIADAVA